MATFFFWLIASTAAGSAAESPLRVPAEIAFGDIPNDRRVSRAVTVTSTASVAIKIRRVSTSCGCLTARIDPENILPKGLASLLLDWDPRGKIGTNEKRVTIQGDAGGKAFETGVRVTGDVSFHGKAGTLFEGSCNACHGAPAAGKKGAELYAAVCAVCHGAGREGVAPSPPLAQTKLTPYSDRWLFDLVYDGSWDKGMPGFGLKAGGPLDSTQIASLVRLLRAAP